MAACVVTRMCVSGQPLPIRGGLSPLLYSDMPEWLPSPWWTLLSIPKDKLLQFDFQKLHCVFCIGYKHSCIFLGFFSNKVSGIHHGLMNLNLTMVLVGMGSLAKAGTPWFGVEIQSHVGLWHWTCDAHGTSVYSAFDKTIWFQCQLLGRKENEFAQDWKSFWTVT